MGQSGTQSFSFRQNKTLFKSRTNGIKIYLFESYRKKQYYFGGEVKLFDESYFADELDTNLKLRRVCKFPLIVTAGNLAVINEVDINESENDEAREIRKLSDNEVKRRAMLSAQNKYSRITRTKKL